MCCSHAASKIQRSIKSAFRSQIAMWRPLSDDGVPLKALWPAEQSGSTIKRPPYLFVTNKSSCGRFFLPPSNTDCSIDRLE